MKKIASLVMTALFISQLLIPCFAANRKEITKVGSTSIVISTSAPVKYTISFPANVKISQVAKLSEIGEFKAVNLRLAPKKEIKVEISSLNDFKLIHEKDSKKTLEYQLLTGNRERLNFSFSPGDSGKAVPLTVKVSPELWLSDKNVDYSDLLTFNVSYVNK